ncbi:MAG: hypothetical protein IJB17_01550 [Oscillospiraceae bacterium]|nr:hypothetical protein [Oscillospiraceae bacterium]
MKRWIAMLLIMVFTLSGCGLLEGIRETDPAANPVEGNTGTDADYLSLTAELEQARKVKLELGSEAAPLADYAQTILALRDEGLNLLSYGLVWPAEYDLCYALSCTSSLRYAADLLLEARGEAIKTDRYADWDTIGAISMACPCPFMLEALVCKETGDTARAEACLEMAALNPQKVHGVEGFDALPGMSTAGLKELKEKLEAFEDHLLDLWPAEPIAAERCGYEFSTEYHYTRAAVALKYGDQWLALDFYEKALQTNPFLADTYLVCAAQAINVESPETILAYLRGGLALDETHPGLNAMAAAFWLSAGEEELYQEHLAAARASDRLTDEMAAFCDSLEGRIS